MGCWLTYDIDLEPAQLPELLQLLFNTYPYYHDRESRQAVQQCLRTVFQGDTPYQALAGFVELVHKETQKPGIAPSNAFVLVEWSSLLLQELTGTPHWDRWGLQTVESNAQVLEICVGEYARSNVKHSALVVSRRGLRKVFSIDENKEKVIQDVVEVLSSKKSQPSSRNAIMLGVVAGVCARKPAAKEILSKNKSQIYSFYTREIIGSKALVPAHIAAGLGDFFESFVDHKDLLKEVVPALEKSLLRAPEIVLNDLVTPLFCSLPKTIDTSQMLSNNLLKSLLANVKSSNVIIRQGVLTAFKAVIANASDAAVVAKVAEEIVVPLKTGKLATPEQRTLHAEMIALLPISSDMATKTSTSLATIAGKEANEAALLAETKSLTQIAIWSVHNNEKLDKSVLDVFAKGVADKKVPIRRLWHSRLGDIFWAIEDESLLKSNLSTLAEAVMSPLIALWQEVLTNPLAAGQTGIIGAGYVFTALANSKLKAVESEKVSTALKKAQVAQQALIMDPKPSYLLNHRIYGKLTTEEEYLWFIRALASILPQIITHDPKSAIALGWSQAVLYSVCSSSIPPATRKIAVQTLSQMYISHPLQVSQIMIVGIWQWRDSLEAGDKEGASIASKTDNQNMHLVVKAICLPPSDSLRTSKPVDEAILHKQLIDLLILSRNNVLPRLSWIDMCLRVGIDPGQLARANEDTLLDNIVQRTQFSETVSLSFPGHIYLLTPHRIHKRHKW